MFRPRSSMSMEVGLHNIMLKGFIVQNIFVEITALISIAISLIFL